MKKRIASFVAVLLILLSLAGCSGSAKDKTFESDGLTVTLTNAFSKAEYELYTVCYDSPKVAVFALKEDFEAVGVSDLTVEEYADVVLQANNLQEEVVYEEGVTYFVFETNIEDGSYTYLAAMYKGTDAYWLVQFACRTEHYESMKHELIKYAQSVKV